VDISPAALAVAKANAKALQLTERADFYGEAWNEAIPPKNYQIVVANPPYIPSNDMNVLMPEVVDFEPHLALDGGRDGLRCYREIAKILPVTLAPAGTLKETAAETIVIMEVGAGQDQAVADIFESAGFGVKAIKKDLAGIARCVICTYSQL
jgi:release factor glutamine methyltransferase